MRMTTMSVFPVMLIGSGALVTLLIATASGRSRETPVLPAVSNNQLHAVADFAAIADSKERSAALFVEASRVLLHPRCANCHPDGDVPLQGMQMNGQPLARSIPSMQVVSET